MQGADHAVTLLLQVCDVNGELLQVGQRVLMRANKLIRLWGRGRGGIDDASPPVKRTGVINAASPTSVSILLTFISRAYAMAKLVTSCESARALRSAPGRASLVAEPRSQAADWA